MENGLEPVSSPADLQPAALAPPPKSAQPTRDASEALRKRVLIGFGGIMAIGLAVAMVYIGGRVFAARATHRVPVQVALKPAASPVEPIPPIAVVTSPVEAPQPAASGPASSEPAPGSRPLIDPKQGELYLQLAALGPTATDRYVPRLAAVGIHALVAPGPDASVYRILLGPFADRTALELQQRMLEMQGIEPFTRKY